MAHKNIEQLEILLQLLDHPLIDIYLHLDSKSSINPKMDVDCPKFSKLIFVPRHDTRWGDISQVETEMELFHAVYNSGGKRLIFRLDTGSEKYYLCGINFKTEKLCQKKK